MSKVEVQRPAELALVNLRFGLVAVALSITEGIAFGFISYSVLNLVTGRAREVHWAFHLIAATLVLRYVFLPPGT